MQSSSAEAHPQPQPQTQTQLQFQQVGGKYDAADIRRTHSNVGWGPRQRTLVPSYQDAALHDHIHRVAHARVKHAVVRGGGAHRGPGRRRRRPGIAAHHTRGAARAAAARSAGAAAAGGGGMAGGARSAAALALAQEWEWSGGAPGARASPAPGAHTPMRARAYPSPPL